MNEYVCIFIPLHVVVQYIQSLFLYFTAPDYVFSLQRMHIFCLHRPPTFLSVSYSFSSLHQHPTTTPLHFSLITSFCFCKMMTLHIRCILSPSRSFPHWVHILLYSFHQYPSLCLFLCLLFTLVLLIPLEPLHCSRVFFYV